MTQTKHNLSHSIKYYLTSAKSNFGVFEAFSQVSFLAVGIEKNKQQQQVEILDNTFHSGGGSGYDRGSFLNQTMETQAVYSQ